MNDHLNVDYKHVQPKQRMAWVSTMVWGLLAVALFLIAALVFAQALKYHPKPEPGFTLPPGGTLLCTASLPKRSPGALSTPVVVQFIITCKQGPTT